jgi:hypothetical protein
MMSRVSTIFGAAFSLILIAALDVVAQGGGKAEPKRIEFKRGTTTTTVVDKIKNDEEAEYVIAARKGQRLTIRLTSTPSRSAVFDIKAPGDADLGLEFDANYSFNKILPATGDYFITVDRPTTSRGIANYKMVITIR